MEKHTKWRMAMLLPAAVLFAACASGPAAAPSTSPFSHASHPASIPVPSTSSFESSIQVSGEPNAQPNSADTAPPEGFGGVWVSSDGVDKNDQVLRLATLTDEQKDAIATLVQSVLDGYREGWLPLPVVQGSEYYMNDPMPKGVTLPETVSFYDLTLVEVMERTQIMAYLPLAGGYTLQVGISLASVADADYTGYRVYIDNAKFEPSDT